MKRQPGRAGEMPAEHALLGLIVLGGGEAYGYDLARHFDAEQPLGAVLRLEQAMLYQHLKKLERREWLSGSLRRAPPRSAQRRASAASRRPRWRRSSSTPGARQPEWTSSRRANGWSRSWMFHVKHSLGLTPSSSC